VVPASQEHVDSKVLADMMAETGHPGFALAVLGGYAAIALVAASLRMSHRDA
jgi:hypothetical protein